MIKLNPRLATCAAYVSDGGVVIDVGTDHGYLPCYLVESGKCRAAYACDIAEGPLGSAREHISRSGLEDKITAVLSDGLLQLGDEAAASATDIVIAGMGGELIAEIIGRGMDAGKLNKSACLILQPNSKVPILRKFLSKNGFRTILEQAVRDGDFIYVVIVAMYDGVSYDLNDALATVGKLDMRDPVGREYLEKEAERLRRAAKGLSKSLSIKSRKQAKEFISRADSIMTYMEIMK